MATQTETSRTIRVGAVVAAALAVLMLILFFIGAEQKVFARKHEYKVRLESASGLAQGNPVQLAGVTIGVVKDIDLPETAASTAVNITIMIDRKYAQRIRTDSRARLKKLGLIAADSYVEISPGSSAHPVLPPGSTIPAAPGTDVEKLIASGGDIVDNFAAISVTMRNILERVDRGEGLLGELTSETGTRQRVSDTLLGTLNRTNAILSEVQSGRGVLGKLVYDDRYAADLTSSLQASVSSLQAITGSIQRGEGALGALLTDPEGKERVNRLVENMTITSENLAALTEGMKTGEGLLPRLLSDREYGDQTLREFQVMVSRLSETARKLSEGEGTAGRVISDPSLYEAINDIVIGINESKLLRWLIRNRQQKGIETRYKAAQQQEKAPPAPVPPVPASDGDGSKPPVEPTSNPSPPPRGPQP